MKRLVLFDTVTHDIYNVFTFARKRVTHSMRPWFKWDGHKLGPRLGLLEIVSGTAYRKAMTLYEGGRPLGEYRWIVRSLQGLGNAKSCARKAA